jgi:sialic acid synthase SpsE
MPDIIADCCQNHNGDPNLLTDMVHAAAEAGVTYVKYQDFRSCDLTEKFAHDRTRMATLDLPDDVVCEFIETAHRAGVKAMVTISNYGRIPFHAGLDWDAVKVASPDCTSYPFLRALAERFDEVYVSTGGAVWAEVCGAVRELATADLTLLHCVSLYPTPLDRINLGRMIAMSAMCPRAGFSDHTLTARDGLVASKAALVLGADVVERHFTLLEPGDTRDGPISINTDLLRDLCEFADMVDGITDTDDPGTDEQDTIARYRGRFAHHHADGITHNWELNECATSA